MLLNNVLSIRLWKDVRGMDCVRAQLPYPLAFSLVSLPLITRPVHEIVENGEDDVVILLLNCMWYYVCLSYLSHL